MSTQEATYWDTEITYPTIDELNEMLAWTYTYDSARLNALCDELDQMTGINTRRE